MIEWSHCTVAYIFIQHFENPVLLWHISGFPLDNIPVRWSPSLPSQCFIITTFSAPSLP